MTSYLLPLRSRGVIGHNVATYHPPPQNDPSVHLNKCLFSVDMPFSAFHLHKLNIALEHDTSTPFLSEAYLQDAYSCRSLNDQNACGSTSMYASVELGQTQR